MARNKKESSVIEKAQVRLAALKSIDPALSLGNSLTLNDYSASVASARQALDTYNSLLSQVDEAYNTFLAQEKSLRDMSERMLAGVAANFGKDSNQYEMAGGVRKSERKPRVRKVQSAA